MAVSTRRLAMFLGGTFLMGAGLVAAACGTDNGTTAVPTTDGGGRDTSSSSSSSSSSGSNGEGGPTDAGPDCANIPTPKSSPGPFCFGAGDAAPDGATTNTNCDGKQEICCSGGRIGDAGFAPSQCETATADAVNGGYATTAATCAATTNAKQWHCMESAHCPGAGEVCCAIASDAGSPKPGQDKDFPGCPVYFQSGRFTDGTRCEKTECKAGELTLCASDAECKAGKCVPLTIEGRYGGYCRVQAQ